MGEIAIVGAGIIGLYTALLLCRSETKHKIVIYAKHLPGDQSINYTSPTAGANFSCISGSDKAAIEYDRISYPLIGKLVDEYGERAGLARLPTTEFFDEVMDSAKLNALKSYVPDLEIVPDEKLAKVGAKFGLTYTTYNFYSPKFLKFLQAMLTSFGVSFVRRDLNSLEELGRKEAIFNCCGGAARQLVNDPKSYPTRGTVLVVRAPHVQENMSFFTKDREPIYIIPRPSSGGRVILGGLYQPHNFDPNVYADDTARIMDKTTRLLPKLLDYGPLEVLDERTGLRPSREGGARIQKEIVNGVTVIHNYGAGGTGYQSGLGMATKALSLYFRKEPRL